MKLLFAFRSRRNFNPSYRKNDIKRFDQKLKAFTQKFGDSFFLIRGLLHTKKKERIISNP